ncbi:MAG: class I SAM-dependent methyltransferase [Candidatus Zixiibacteriota bacterium]
MKTSDKKHWEDFWKTKDLKDIYPVGDRVIKAIEKHVDPKGLRILEVGAGTGRDSYELAKKGAEVYVLDYAESALMLYKKQNMEKDQKAIAVCGDAFGLPFADNSFDIVFHQGLLEHFREPLGIIKENQRVLKPKGFVIIDVPQRWHIYTVIKHILIAFNSWFAGWETEFSITQVEKILKQHDLEPFDFYGEWMYPSLAYRTLREILWKIKIKLPLYPFKIPGLYQIRRFFHYNLPKNRFFANTCLSIGVLGRKNEKKVEKH